MEEKKSSNATSVDDQVSTGGSTAVNNVVMMCTFITQSGKSCESLQGFQQVNVSGTIQQALASQNVAITAIQGPFDNPASRPLPMVTSQYRPNVACVYQSSKCSIGFQANRHGLDPASGSGLSADQAICINPNRTMMNTTRGCINNSNPPKGATRYQPNVAYAQQGSKFPSRGQTYRSNGFVYSSSARGRNNQPIHLGPNAVLVSPNAMTETANQLPLNTTPPPVVASQYRLNTSSVGQASNFSNGFQASAYPFSPTTASNTIPLIPMSLNGTTMFTTNNNTNPEMGVPQNQPSAAFANQGTTFPNRSQTYGTNGILYLNGGQGINNQPTYLRPNGGGASMAPVVPQNQGLGYGNPVYYRANQGMMGGMKEMAIGAFASGIGESFGGEMFQGVTSMWGGNGGSGGGHEGSMGLDGSETLDSYVDDYF